MGTLEKNLKKSCWCEGSDPKVNEISPASHERMRRLNHIKRSVRSQHYNVNSSLIAQCLIREAVSNIVSRQAGGLH